LRARNDGGLAFPVGSTTLRVVPIVASKIEDYAIIGDCETAALAARAGSTGCAGRAGARRAYR
jgi:hypothetical protein